MTKETLAFESIWIITDEVPSSNNDGSKGISLENPWNTSNRESVPMRTLIGVEVSIPKLQAEMAKFYQVIDLLFYQTQQHNLQSGLQLSEVELSVEINGEGQVKLMGIGGKAGTKGAITLKFKKQVN